MKVLVLAAGRSKRMKPVKDKNFLNFLGKTLIQRQLELVKSAGLKNVILVAGDHNVMKMRKLKIAGLNIKIVVQKNLEMGMCGAVLAAKKIIGKEPVIVFSSNDVVEKSAFELVMEEAKKNNAESFIIGKKVKKYFPGGYLEVNSKGLISKIVEKPTPGKEPSDMINLVVHLHKNPSTLISYLEKIGSEKDDMYEAALSKMIKNGVKMKAVKYSGEWLPIKFPWHVMPVFNYFFEKEEARISKKTQIAKSAIIKGKVIIEDGVKIFENAVVSGPCYVGKNSIIANNSLVRGSHVGENCVIGFCTEVARSFLGSGVWTHTNYIGDSVIGNNVSFGSGSVTGNLRLDEGNILVAHEGKKLDTGSNKFGLVTGDNIRVGVNTSFMPGVKIGEKSFVGAGILVAENIPENSFVRGNYVLKISENKMKVDNDREKFKKNMPPVG